MGRPQLQPVRRMTAATPTVPMHELRTCPRPDCPWEADDDTPHAHDTVTRTHPTTHCHREGCHDPR